MSLRRNYGICWIKASDDGDCRRENITRPSDRLDQFWAACVNFQFFPQSAYLGVYGPVEGGPFLSLSQIHKSVARQHLIAVFDQNSQQFEFCSGQGDNLAVGLDQAATMQIQLPSRKAQHFMGRAASLSVTGQLTYHLYLLRVPTDAQDSGFHRQ